MTRKGYRRITCPVCGTWLFLRPVSYDYGHPQPDPMEYRLTAWHSWHLDDDQATRIVNAVDPADLVVVRASVRAESLETGARWERERRESRLAEALDVRNLDRID